MKLMVTGGTGLVGSNIIKVAGEECPQLELVGTVFSRMPTVAWDFETVQLDLEHADSILRAMDETRPDTVIHCGAVRDEDRLERDHAWGWNLMVTGTEVLARACQRLSAKLIFISSCWTFGNRGEPPYAEDSPSCPVNYFGLLKTVGETLVRTLCDNYAITRLPGIQGINWSSPAYNLDVAEEGIGCGSMVNYFWYRLSRGLPVVVWSEYYNQFDNSIEASDLARLLLAVATQGHRGVFHCCGGDGVSRLEVAQIVAEEFGYDPALVRPARPEEMDARLLAGKLTSPRDTRLQFARSEARLGCRYPSFRDGVRKFRGYVKQLGQREVTVGG